MKLWTQVFECTGEPTCGSFVHVEVSAYDDEPHGIPFDRDECPVPSCPECGCWMFPVGEQVEQRRPSWA